MKIHHSPFFYLFSLFLLLTGCHSDPPAASTVNPPPVDTSDQMLTAEEKTASLEKLLEQYNPPGRDAWQKPEKVIDKMGDLSDKVVADLGAGSGEFSFRLAQEAKKVIALEIDERFIELMDSIKMIQLKPEFRHRLETRQVTPTDSKLKANEADVILIVNTYIYIKNRDAYLKHLLDVMPEGGQIIIVDFKKKRIPVKFPRQQTRLELFNVENELYRAGFKNIESDDSSLNYQYIVSAKK